MDLLYKIQPAKVASRSDCAYTPPLKSTRIWRV